MQEKNDNTEGRAVDSPQASRRQPEIILENLLFNRYIDGCVL